MMPFCGWCVCLLNFSLPSQKVGGMCENKDCEVSLILVGSVTFVLDEGHLWN